MEHVPPRQILLHDTLVVRSSLSELLNIDIQKVITEFPAVGHSGSTYKITTFDRSEQKREFILKCVSDDSYYNFYEEVLSQYEFDSPRIFGIISVGEILFLVMEFVPHESAEWNNKLKYKQAVEWLIKKDTITNNNLNELVSCSSVQSSVRDNVDQWLATIRRGFELKVHPLMTGHDLNILFRKRNYFHKVNSLLSQKQQTINHNDFQMFNILFGNGQKKGKLYVIDWSGPNIGSVCIDLAKLIRVAPNEFSTYLLTAYRSQINFEGFDEIFKAAQIRTNLLIFAWMVEMLINGRGHAISLPQFQAIFREIIKL
jgi:thiamine kinase-like enzyme